MANTTGLQRANHLFREGSEKTQLFEEPNREDMIQSLENIKKSVSEFPSLVRDLKEYLDNRCTHFGAGCITQPISNWQMIASDKEIWTPVRGATIEFDTQPYNTKRPQSTFSAKESAIIDSEVAKLLSKNIIETTDHTPYEVISNIFIRPQKDGGHRLILNLKGLNQFVTYHHFKMETLQSIVRLVEKNCYMALLEPQGCLLYGWRERLAQEIPTFHVERCSVSVHVPTQRVILLPPEIHKIAKTAAYRITQKGSHIS